MKNVKHKKNLCPLRNLGKEEETGGDRQEEGGGPRPPRGGQQGQEGQEGFHDP